MTMKIETHNIWVWRVMGIFFHRATTYEKFLRDLRKTRFFTFQKHQKSPLNTKSFGVWFPWNRQKLLSAAAKSFLRVVPCCKLYPKFAWTLRIIFYMHNVLRKCLDIILRTKKEASSKFQKSFFWHLILNFGSFGVWFP